MLHDEGPRDYGKPASGDVKLAVSRKKATGEGKPLGSLLVNPGGPGGSAVGYLQQYAGIGYPAEVRAATTWSPSTRAVWPAASRSSASTGPHGRLCADRHDPDDQKEKNLLVDAYQRFAEGCGRQSADLLRHVSTVEVARDMDILRAVLGDQKLNYVGASYGTFLGATYAGLFPERVGRLVLDGAMDPSISALRLNEDQTAGFETAFQSFAKDCVRQPNCPLGGPGTPPARVGDNLKAFFKKLDASPPHRRHERPQAQRGYRHHRSDRRDVRPGGLAPTAGGTDLGDEEERRRRTAPAVGQLLRAGRGRQVREPHVRERGRELPGPATGVLEPAGRGTGAPVVREGVTGVREGLAWASLSCAYWPVKATGQAHRIEAKGAAPILVVGTTRDPATPYPWAQSLAAQLSSGRLLTYEGDGHTAYGRGSKCIEAAVDAYLLRGTPPEDGKRCS